MCGFFDCLLSACEICVLCYNHQLHLVEIHGISEDQKVQQYFDICSVLYNFTRKHTVAAIYTGTRLARLLEQRWEGHWKTTMVILENYDANVNLLERCRDGELSGEIAIEATSLLARITEPRLRIYLQPARLWIPSCSPSKVSDMKLNSMSSSP